MMRQLSHSTETDARFYQALSGPSHAAEAFISLNRMRKERKDLKPSGHVLSTPSHALATVSPTTSQSDVHSPIKKRVPFTTEEEETIRLYFEDYLKFKKTPSLSECSTFLTNHPLNRNPKQIQDKIKNFSKE